MLVQELTAKKFLASVNKAVAELTEEVNTKMNQVKGYIDSSLAALMNKLIDNKYKYYYSLWTHCINAVTAEDVLSCQAVKHMIKQASQVT